MTMGFILVMILCSFGFVFGIITMAHRYEMEKLKLTSKLDQEAQTEATQVSQTKTIEQLRKRIENLEAIIVDQDLLHKTGLEDDVKMDLENKFDSNIQKGIDIQ